MPQVGEDRYSGNMFGRWRRGCGTALTLLTAAFVLGGVTTPIATATPDDSDAFYQPPADLADAAPGTILRTREIEPSFFQALPMRVSAWQLLYRTTDADGQPYSAVTTVLKSADNANPSAVLSFQNMTDSIAPQCMPSQALQQGRVPWLDLSQPSIDLTTMANESPMVAAALARGWAVSVPDYGGVDNHFLTPREPGYVVLDGLRAAENFTPTGLSGADTRAMLWGYSGGGIASGWAAQEQPRYAPELNLIAAALGAPVGDFRAGLRSANGTPIGGALVPIALMGMMQGAPEFTAALDRYLTPAGQQKIAAAVSACTPQNLLSNIGFDATHYMTASLDEVLADPVISAAIDAAQLGAETPTAPLYVYNAISDEISTIGGVDTLVSTYCDSGTPVTYRREQLTLPVSGHTLEWGLGSPGALAWLQSRADSAEIPTGCDTRSVPETVLAPDSLTALTSGMLGGSLRALLGG